MLLQTGQHWVREGTRSQQRKIHGGVKDETRRGTDRSLKRVWSEDTCVRANTGREEATTVQIEGGVEDEKGWGVDRSLGREQREETRDALHVQRVVEKTQQQGEE